MASYKTEYMTNNSNSWTSVGTYGSEHDAILSAKNVIKRSNVKTVRVKDSGGSVVYIDSN